MLRRQALRGALSRRRSAEALEDLASITFAHYAHTYLVENIWELRHKLTTYDAAYFALAEALDAPLVTTDARLVQATGICAAVELYR